MCTACKNTVDHLNGIFVSIARIRFDSHVFHWKEAYKKSGYICILNVLVVITYCFQQFASFSLLQYCMVCQSAFFCQTIGNPRTGMYKVICTFQCHSWSHGSVPLTSASLCMAVLNKICSSSFNHDHFVYFIILKTDHNEQNTSCYFPLFQNCVSTFFGALNEAL